MKFRFYIQDPFEGCYVGTNDAQVAWGFAESEEYFVLDAETGEWMIPGGERVDVTEVDKHND